MVQTGKVVVVANHYLVSKPSEMVEQFLWIWSLAWFSVVHDLYMYQEVVQPYTMSYIQHVLLII
jgi:hypothetical protein